MATTSKALKVATAAIIAAHNAELEAYLRDQVPANQWRPEKYAEKTIQALADSDLLASSGRQGTDTDEASLGAQHENDNDEVRLCASCGLVELPSECQGCIDAVTEQ